MGPWYRRRWAPWAVTLLQATAGAAAAGLVAIGAGWLTRPPASVCAAGWPCAGQLALGAVALAATYFVASVAVAAAIGVSELAGPEPVRLRLGMSVTGPPLLAAALALLI